MKFLVFSIGIALLMSCTDVSSPSDKKNDTFPVTLVIHGGAGMITRGSLSKENEQAYHDKLKQALDTGYIMLSKGKTSTEVVISVISMLEDSPLFNAGKGSVFTATGANEMDASIMDGGTLNAGSIAGVTVIKNPIKAAYEVMINSPHVMLSGKGAEAFAMDRGLEIVDPSYFKDSIRYEHWKNMKLKETSDLNSSAQNEKFGTVGCVALDRFGNISAGTSTGGMTNKKYGRIGDSPIIGAGTYANNTTCGVSATGWGEYFIRLAVAHDISAQIEYTTSTLQHAADNTILKKLPALGGDGGIIALNQAGEVVMSFNTTGMFRGYKKQGEEARTFIYKD